MVNLKLDLINKVKNDKYYDELELVRLGGDVTMNYKQKLDNMSHILHKIGNYNAQLDLIEYYFREQQQPPIEEQRVATQQPPVKHQGQTHGE